MIRITFSLQKTVRIISIFNKEQETTDSRNLLLAGAEGIEPSAYGFGDRRSTS